jgi:hypothetical protein
MFGESYAQFWLYHFIAAASSNKTFLRKRTTFILLAGTKSRSFLYSITKVLATSVSSSSRFKVPITSVPKHPLTAVSKHPLKQCNSSHYNCEKAPTTTVTKLLIQLWQSSQYSYANALPTVPMLSQLCQSSHNSCAIAPTAAVPRLPIYLCQSFVYSCAKVPTTASPKVSFCFLYEFHIQVS